MTYAEAKDYIKETVIYGSVLGLQNIQELLRRLSNPQNDLHFIHIAGTNGKGSVTSYITSILRQAGYCTGKYISPALFSYREIIQVNDRYIEKEALAIHTETIRTAIMQMLQDGLSHPTQFEIETALAFLYFREKQCDLVVLETGLGGLEDATNVIQTTLLEIITPISKDHIAILGNSIEEIARQKAGIIKPNTTVVTAYQESKVMDVLQAVCKENSCTLNCSAPNRITQIRYGYEEQLFSYETENGTFYSDLRVHLAGIHQIQNAALAVEAISAFNQMGFSISPQQLRQGLAAACWKGRFTILQRNPLFIIDGAHNEAAALQLKASLETYFPNQKLIFILGIFKDKDYESISKHTASLAAEIILIEMEENRRLLPAEQLKETVMKYNTKVQIAGDPEEAVRKSLCLAAQDDVILAFGSLSFLHSISNALNHIDTIRKQKKE